MLHLLAVRSLCRGLACSFADFRGTFLAGRQELIRDLQKQSQEVDKWSGISVGERLLWTIVLATSCAYYGKLCGWAPVSILDDCDRGGQTVLMTCGGNGNTALTGGATGTLGVTGALTGGTRTE